MRCLVTGGTGFIGSNLALELEKQGHEVVIADNFGSGHRENVEGFKELARKAGKSEDEIVELMNDINNVDNVMRPNDAIVVDASPRSRKKSFNVTDHEAREFIENGAAAQMADYARRIGPDVGLVERFRPSEGGNIINTPVRINKIKEDFASGKLTQREAAFEADLLAERVDNTGSVTVKPVNKAKYSTLLLSATVKTLVVTTSSPFEDRSKA